MTYVEVLTLTHMSLIVIEETGPPKENHVKNVQTHKRPWKAEVQKASRNFMLTSKSGERRRTEFGGSGDHENLEKRERYRYAQVMISERDMVSFLIFGYFI